MKIELTNRLRTTITRSATLKKREKNEERRIEKSYITEAGSYFHLEQEASMFAGKRRAPVMLHPSEFTGTDTNSEPILHWISQCWQPFFPVNTDRQRSGSKNFRKFSGTALSPYPPPSAIPGYGLEASRRSGEKTVKRTARWTALNFNLRPIKKIPIRAF